MKGILSLVAGGLLAFSAAGFAAEKAPTALDANWLCTTNASSSSVAADQAADKQMKEQAKSAADAFAFATQNCRDCTKITCKVHKE